jgi:hypothetical protein
MFRIQNTESELTYTEGGMKPKPKSTEYKAFSNLLARIATVPHDTVKAKLEAEKKAKRSKREERPKRLDR